MMTAHFVGILFGLGAAASQSVSYVFSRRFTRRAEGDVMLLLVVSFLIMGLAALALLVVMRPSGLPPLRTYVVPMAGAGAFCLIAQVGLFHVLHRVESSRVAPLLGMKIVVLALLAVALTGQRLGVQQWTAVALCSGATWLLNEAGGRIPARDIGVLMLTILGYCASDLSIGVLMRRMTAVRPFAPLVAAALTYVLTALLVLPFAFRRRVYSAEVWRTALPFAMAWFAAMCLLFGCFALAGVVFGNIVQSARGLISIAGGWLLATMGHTHLERKVGRRVFWSRMAGAILMVAAVVLYAAA